MNASSIVPVIVTKAPASGKSYGYIIESGGIKFNPDGQHPVKSQLITAKYLFPDFQLNLHFQFPEDFPELYSDQRKMTVSKLASDSAEHPTNAAKYLRP